MSVFRQGASVGQFQRRTLSGSIDLAFFVTTVGEDRL
jgi:hypothetical protein